MNDKIDDAIERLLYEAAPDPVADEGFCAGLIGRLPPRRPRTKWLHWVGVAAGMLACWFSFQSAQIPLAGWHDLLSGDLTSSALVLLVSATGLSLLTLAWALVESHEQAL